MTDAHAIIIVYSLTVERPNGSKSFDVPPGEKGMGSGPSFPTMPPANASMLVLEVTPLDGANADADAASAANRKNLTMVELMSSFTSNRSKACASKDRKGFAWARVQLRMTPPIKGASILDDVVCTATWIRCTGTVYLTVGYLTDSTYVSFMKSFLRGSIRRKRGSDCPRWKDLSSRTTLSSSLHF